ncbi:hypothetical protein J3R30DRAFT_3743736 [Lentinula aciculospora]|uniref:DUF726-domain-containing protein n=1 Tax=Lentinula aciculospora TaxID=153920 RepID=A0A9W9DDU2_9AGAR|nr:hypothetical protein J3R30DRAFT_3743736 [Lentinula aciculospora]
MKAKRATTPTSSSSDESGWEDMPIVYVDEMRGGLDEEDQRRYHYRPDESASGRGRPGNEGGNATGTTLDTDEYGFRWRSNPMQSTNPSSSSSPYSSSHAFSTESNYTRLRHVEEDWEESEDIVNASRVLFQDHYLEQEKRYAGLDDRKAITPLSQMQQTKRLLSESQRIAYVGLCALVINSMLVDLQGPSTGVRSAKKKKKLSAKDKDGVQKELGNAVKSMQLWGMKIMGRLYYHIGLDSSEQQMIESLSTHGVRPQDLLPPLVQMQDVVNPEWSYTYRAGTPEDHDHDHDHDPPIPKYITLDMRYTLLTDLFLILVADSVYDSRSRSLLFQIGSYLSLSPWDILVFEGRIVEAVGIIGEDEPQHASDDHNSGLQQNTSAVQEQIKRLRNRRIALLGLATLGGGLVIGLSAGLLAPVIGVGLGTAFSTIGLTGASTFLAGSTGAAVITTGGVLTGAGIAGKGMIKRTQVVTVFDVLPIHRNGRVGCVLTVPGFLNGPLDDPRLPFSVLDPVVGDVFSVLWEPEMIRETGSALSILTGEVLSQIGQTVLQATVMATLMTALQWPIILTKLGYLIDNPWSNALDRAQAAGLVLASILRDRQLGVRPTTLIGFSLGARVIFYALLELSRLGCFGIIQDVYLMGATISVGNSIWEETRGVVGGRYVNVYARNDWVLNYLFRASSAATGNVNTVAGLRPIEGVRGLENVDVTDKIAGHMSYRVYMPVILEELGFKVTERWFDEVEEPDFEGDRVVQTPEEQQQSSKSKKAGGGWFGKKSKSSKSSNKNDEAAEAESQSQKKKKMDNLNVQRPPSWASWAEKDKAKGVDKGKDKERSEGTEDDEYPEGLPPREGTPIHKISIPLDSSSRSSPPTKPNPNILNSDHIISTIPKTAGFDIDAIKAVKAELVGIDGFGGFEGMKTTLSAVEAPRLDGGITSEPFIGVTSSAVTSDPSSLPPPPTPTINSLSITDNSSLPLTFGASSSSSFTPSLDPLDPWMNEDQDIKGNNPWG